MKDIAVRRTTQEKAQAEWHLEDSHSGDLEKSPVNCCNSNYEYFLLEEEKVLVVNWQPYME